MTSSPWKKRLAVVRNRLYLYPEPEPLARDYLFWICMALVGLVVIAFSAYFVIYLNAKQDAFMTNAEDLGIMDQVVWSILHGPPVLHETICNIVGDTNCYSTAGYMRFAIHFEPILFPLSLLYWVAPSPKTLQNVQTIVVALGAFPAFWLARLRLRSSLAALAFPVIYLCYPALQYAMVNDFHAVTFTAALLMFTLYFMYTRKTVWLFVFAILAMACKEEIPILIIGYALWSIIFQQRWRTGVGLAAVALLWIGVEYWAMRHFSPTGQALLRSRYAYLGHGPVGIAKYVLTHPGDIIRTHIIAPAHRDYLKGLMSPALYLPLLAPWVLVLALPTLAINMLSTDANMYSGMFQYNAEIVPVLVFSAIEATVLIVWLVMFVYRRWSARQAKVEPAVATAGEPEVAALPARSARSVQWGLWLQRGVLVVIALALIYNGYRIDKGRGQLPISAGFIWPVQTHHTDLAQSIINMIPPDASVSAQSGLVPHVSQRKNIYLFPYAKDSAQYIFLDVTGDTYPYDFPGYHIAVRKVMQSGDYGVLAANNGYLLLKRGLTPPAPVSQLIHMSQEQLLSTYIGNFCSFMTVSPDQVTTAIQQNKAQAVNVDFRGGSEPNGLHLMAYSVVGSSHVHTSSLAPVDQVQVTTYWQVSQPTKQPLQLGVYSIGSDGSEHFASQDFPNTYWCPTNAWKPGTIVQLTGKYFSFPTSETPVGQDKVAIALVPGGGNQSTIMNVAARIPVHFVSGPASVAPTAGTKGLTLSTITIAP
ncbi:MAG TPA: DUF2079 domain-containing protein [Ktedonobacteraceae bacterium]|nr:DUF2079 domain-containing protein [Ktedonobacteraceae bacterium]